MSLTNLTIMYGHLEGAGRDFARDPSGYLSIEKGIFQKHGLDISWQHVQGTEERYRKLADGSAQISLLVGRASLQHFLASQSTRILGCVMNSCPSYLMASPTIGALADLKGKVVVCREGPSRGAPIAATFDKLAKLRVGSDLTLEFPSGDQHAFDMLIEGKTQAALLPRPFGFIAEARGFRRLKEWPDVVDDPLPISIETTEKFWREREGDCAKFLAAHSEGVLYFKTHREEALRILQQRFGHVPVFAERIFDEYIVCMDETLKVDFDHFARLLAQTAPERDAEGRQIAAQWIVGGALKG
ncbi:MAG TPA: hypothetical protein VLA17_00195 [Candidatus Limnocylindria bacterium]|nr:hypothetical protein [Candidatus Limnocylindria bacterium]